MGSHITDMLLESLSILFSANSTAGLVLVSVVTHDLRPRLTIPTVFDHDRQPCVHRLLPTVEQTLRQRVLGHVCPRLHVLYHLEL